jgi:hypothetical protein
VLVACTQPFSFVASQFESSHGGLIGFEPRQDFSIFRCFDIGHITSGELRTIHEGSRCGQMSKRIAHFPLDNVGKRSVSGGQWRADRLSASAGLQWCSAMVRCDHERN